MEGNRIQAARFSSWPLAVSAKPLAAAGTALLREPDLIRPSTSSRGEISVDDRDKPGHDDEAETRQIFKCDFPRGERVASAASRVRA